MRLSQEKIDYNARLYLDPVTLIINFALFQYLCGMYYQRRREVRIKLLLVFGFVGFASLIPFSNPDTIVFGHLNDISERSTTMTFLVQITIIGRDINRKMRVRSLKWLTYISEFLIFLGALLAIKSFIELVAPITKLERLDIVDDIFEDISLWFIFVFRFYYMAMPKGVGWLFQNKRLELCLYGLFMTHEYPFHGTLCDHRGNVGIRSSAVASPYGHHVPTANGTREDPWSLQRTVPRSCWWQLQEQGTRHGHCCCSWAIHKRHQAKEVFESTHTAIQLALSAEFFSRTR